MTSNRGQAVSALSHRTLERVSLTLLLLSCLCAENIPLMAGLVAVAAICAGLNSQTTQNLSIRKPPPKSLPSRAAAISTANHKYTLIIGDKKGKVNYEK